MSSPDRAARVEYLERDSIEEAIEVLSQALEADPLFRFIFKTSMMDYRQSLAELFRFSCEVRFDLDWPLLGCIENKRLVGVAGLSGPEDKPWPQSLRKTYARFASMVGPKATDRLERYSERADFHRPKAPHFHLGVLGVHPSSQGRGFGGQLMTKIHAISEVHPASIGVAVDTENPDNIHFYEQYDYSVVAISELNGIGIWSMFRHDRK